jgi:hypothetical protein
MNTATMSERDVERLAWGMLWGAFTIFLILVIGLPFGLFYYLQNATISQEATLVVLNGTAIVELTGRDPAGAREHRVATEGAIINTDKNTRVLLTLFDGSTAFVLPDTRVRLSVMRMPRFSMSSRHAETQLNLLKGRLRLNTLTSNKPSDLTVQTPQGQAQFQRGSYQIETSAAQTEIIVRQIGTTVVQARDQSLTLSAQERSVIKANEPLQAPLPPLQNLVTNGYFDAPLTTTLAVTETWRVFNDQGGDAGKVDGEAKIEKDNARNVVRFTRRNSGGNHNATVIEQIINQDISNADMMIISADVRLFYQDLAGGGQQSSEFPLMIRVWYVDEFGGINSWVRGFYYQVDPRWRIVNGEEIPKDFWYPYESPDLRNELKPRPARITAIQIYASGWDYDSMVADVRLIVE